MHLHFRKLGEGAPLIILHGLFGSSDNWQTLGKKFSENNFSVYLVDQRNHGRSPHSDDFSYKAMSEDILEMINDEKINDVSIIGHSMGGKTAMQFALDHSEKISKLIIADMAPKKYPVNNSDVSEALLSVDLNKIKSRNEAEQQLAQKISDKGTLQFLLKNLYWKENNQLAWRFNLNAIHAKIDNTNAAIESNNVFEKPTLFLRGENSNYILKEDEPLIRKYFPNAEIKTTPQAGHWIHADNPQWFLEICLGFLQK